MKYLKEIDACIAMFNLTNLNTIDEDLHTITFIKFFNTLTIECLGEPTIQHPYPRNDFSSGSLIYLPEAAKNALIPQLDIIYITNQYAGALSTDKMQYSYENYDQFMIDLLATRKALKKLDLNEQNCIRISIIKYYLNLIYGMLNKEGSVLSSGLSNPRDVVSNNTKDAIATLCGYFLNKSTPVYYVDVDAIYVPSLKENELDEINEYFKKKINGKLNLNVSRINSDDDEQKLTGYLVSKKSRFLTSGKIKHMGMPIVDNEKVLLENKKYFGQFYRELFPEYAFAK